ncbi:MAG: DNA-directed RNA polymerase subunit delta, partial [Anaeroplasmataceae bacterium]|nr:DNA-directed RNA polymerase subunit delta [Anaeroplasmataceae bacterium]
MENVSQMSLLEVAIYLMEQKKAQQNIRALIREVLEIKGLDDADGKLATQLYIDITTSSKFVYMGNEEWDLKCRQSLDEYDKDGSAFNVKGADLDDEPLEDEEDIEEESLDDDEDEYDEDEEDDEDEYDDEY